MRWERCIPEARLLSRSQAGGPLVSVLSISQLQSKLSEYRENGIQGETKEKWLKAKGTLEDLSPEITRLKHILTLGMCRGNVSNGVCRKCTASVMGIIGYAFDIMIRDDDAARNGKLVLKGAEGAGNSLLGMTAESFAMLNDERKADLIEEKTYEKFVFGVWVNEANG